MSHPHGPDPRGRRPRDAGGSAVLFALGFIGPAVLVSPLPILGWALRVRHPRGSAVVVLLGGVPLAAVLVRSGARSLRLLRRGQAPVATGPR